MAKSPEIPQDIIDNIIAAVGDDTRLLKQCTLVSSSFLLPSRKQLFSRIIINCDQTCQGIHQFFIQNPVIQSFVRTITLTEYRISGKPKFPDWINGTSLLAILRLPFCRLECFSICGRRYADWSFPGNSFNSWDWSIFSSELKDALSNIIHSESSTLKTLSLKDITNVPIIFFGHLHLTTLDLSLSPADFRDEKPNLLTRVASNVVEPIASHTVVDRCVWYLMEEESEHGMRETPFICYFSLIRDGEGRTKPIFLPFMGRLRFFEINVNLGPATWHDFDILAFLMGSLYMSMTAPATLEHLKLNVSFCGSDNDFIVREDSFFSDLRYALAWFYLDSITSDPAGSRLQRVDININYSFRCDDNVREPDENEVLIAVLDSLPLLRTKGILFVEAVSE